MNHWVWVGLEGLCDVLIVWGVSWVSQREIRAQNGSQERAEASLKERLKAPGVILAYRVGDSPKVTIIERLDSGKPE